MIEYKTERVDPNYEASTLEINSVFGWQLIESQEVYNESTHVTGATVKSYGAFMQGFTGRDGRVDVQTHTNVTNYIAMRFGRDTQMPGYGRLKELESGNCRDRHRPDNHLDNNGHSQRNGGRRLGDSRMHRFPRGFYSSGHIRPDKLQKKDVALSELDKPGGGHS